MRTDDLVLFATNTGALYAEHVKLARQLKEYGTAAYAVRQWAQFIKSVTLPMYRRELHEPYEGLSLDDIDSVARQLADHYAQHVRELAQ